MAEKVGNEVMLNVGGAACGVCVVGLGAHRALLMSLTWCCGVRVIVLVISVETGQTRTTPPGGCHCGPHLVRAPGVSPSPPRACYSRCRVLERSLVAAPRSLGVHGYTPLDMRCHLRNHIHFCRVWFGDDLPEPQIQVGGCQGH